MRCLPELATFIDTFLDQIGYAFHLSRRDNGANISGFVERITDAQAFKTLFQLGIETICNAFLHQKTRTCAADLTLVKPNGVDDTFNSGIEISIFKYDEGRFATKLQRELLAGTCNLFADDATHLCRAGESNLVDAVMTADARTRCAIALHDIDHTGRQANFVADFCKSDSSQWCEISRLQHHRIASSQGRCDLPRQHQQWEVPRDHLTTNANRREALELIFNHLRPTGMMVEMTNCQRNINVARFTQRFAIIHGFQNREEAFSLLDMAGDCIKIFCTFMAG